MFRFQNLTLEERVRVAIIYGNIDELKAALDVIPNRGDITEDKKNELISSINNYFSKIENGNVKRIGSFVNIYALKKFIEELRFEFSYYKGLNSVNRLLDMSFLDMKINLEIIDEEIGGGPSSETILSIDYKFDSGSNYFYFKWKTGFNEFLIIEGWFGRLDLDPKAMNFNVFIGNEGRGYLYKKIEEHYEGINEIFNNKR
jgi:hypothetical protein